MNTGGPAFPTPEIGATDGRTHDAGMTLLDWYAGQETLAEFDHPEASYGDKLATAFAGPKPQGGWAEDPHGMFEWEARVRAGMKYTRATAMLAEKARREAVVQESSTTQDAANMAELQAANKELVEALEAMVAHHTPCHWVDTSGDQYRHLNQARTALSKHKGAA